MCRNLVLCQRFRELRRERYPECQHIKSWVSWRAQHAKDPCLVRDMMTQKEEEISAEEVPKFKVPGPVA